MCATGKRWLCGLAAVLIAGVGPAQGAGRPPSVEDIPPVERLADDFYNAIAAGPPVAVMWTAAPATVPLGGDITLTLTIRNAANPAELVRPDLRKMPAFTDRFQVFDEPAAPPKAGATEVQFVYKLRPRTVGETNIPGLQYRYYQPRFPEEKRMQTTRAQPVPVTVTPPPATAARPVPLDAPEEFLQLASSDGGHIHVGRWAWLVPIPLAALLTAGATVGWDLFFPNAARRAKARRNRAAREALARLRAAGRSGDAGAAAEAVRGYLIVRWGMAPTAHTPGEIGPALAAVGAPGGRADEAAVFFRACDAARFSDAGDTQVSLAAQGAALVEAWEGDRA